MKNFSLIFILFLNLFITACGGGGDSGGDSGGSSGVSIGGSNTTDGSNTTVKVVEATPLITASFSAYPLHGAPTIAVSFTDITIGDVSSYDWDFGDGGSSSAQNPAHTYTQAGTYTVTLTVSGPEGTASNTQTDYITVAAANSANTYYVDQSHASASDSNLGTQTQPWLTIKHAAQTVQAGDTVIVKTGTYNERIGLPTTGTPGNKITFRAEPRRTVNMWGFDTAGADYLRIEGFNITTALTGWTETRGIFIRSDYVEIVDNYFYDIKNEAIQAFWEKPWPKGIYVADNRIYKSAMGIVASGKDWLIENNEIERLYYTSGGATLDYTRFFGENIIFRNNYFHGTTVAEIGPGSHVDGFQTFDNNGEYARNILIEGNVLRDFHQGFMGQANFYHNSSNITFRNNIFTDSWSWGLAIEGIRNVVVVHNVFANIANNGVGFSNTSSGLVKNNIFYDAGSNYWASATSTVEGGYNILNREGHPNYIEATDIIVDPLFVDVNPLSYDFSLQATSQAIDAGVDVGVTVDIDGNLRPQQGGGVDIGAYEAP